MPQPSPVSYARFVVTAALSALTDDDLRSEFARRGLSDIAAADALTVEQIRGARGLLDWTLHDLAQVSRVSVSVIKRIEDGHEGQARPVKLAAIRRAFEAARVRFVVHDGAPGMVLAHAPLQQAAA